MNVDIVIGGKAIMPPLKDRILVLQWDLIYLTLVVVANSAAAVFERSKLKCRLFPVFSQIFLFLRQFQNHR